MLISPISNKTKEDVINGRLNILGEISPAGDILFNSSTPEDEHIRQNIVSAKPLFEPTLRDCQPDFSNKTQWNQVLKQKMNIHKNA